MAPFLVYYTYKSTESEKPVSIRKTSSVFPPFLCSLNFNICSVWVFAKHPADRKAPPV